MLNDEDEEHSLLNDGAGIGVLIHDSSRDATKASGSVVLTSMSMTSPTSQVKTPTRKISDNDDEGDKQAAKHQLSILEMFGLSVYWFGWSAMMGPMLLSVIPTQIGLIVGKDRRGSALGDVLIWGSLVAVISAPVSGSLSDSSTHRWGKRSPFIATGISIASLSLVMMIVAQSSKSLSFYKFAFLLLSVANNVAMAPYTALVPDLVPTNQRGTASAWLGVMAFLGTFAGGVVNYLFGRHLAVCILILGLLHAATGLVTIRLCKERPLVRARCSSTVCGRLCSLVRPLTHHDFRVMWIARFLMQMGILTVQEYMSYFMDDVIKDFHLFGHKVADSAQQAVSVFMLPVLIASLGSAFIAGTYADRTGKRKMIVYVSGAIMMASCLLLSVTPKGMFGLTLIGAFIFGSGYGAFSVIEWAMATDLLPNPDDFAKDMGVWSLAMTLPQVFSGNLAGFVMKYCKKIFPGSHIEFSAIFLSAMLFLAVGTIYVKKIQSVN
mmetsp:Transcript_15866/g.39129  ORF Transcript_15866/g.39129 Transcript_15866/m.39129 type:complete len:493 (+) Transcript_15866:321-1799(+)|eukprot:CAMPEP_0114524616 /NCGR_PEP_ID=MMETSP0109-20121206/21957_1 /TAXON_ID=29199 /ORGANISM="Chlorarachnion reptans, Strain CCCM449" /LENGTH=492 /DNA_ID=CAMNT_0001706085 /DNA_START=229 /DNA_END=1707 /DNA_ORIENTATION=+